MASKTYIYKDLLTGCEMLNVAHPHHLLAGNDAVLCVQSMMIKENGDSIDVGGGDHFGDGDSEIPLEDGEVVVNNIIATAGLVEVPFKKKALVEWARAYLARVKEQVERDRPERVEAFMKGAQAFVQTLVKEFSEYLFYVNSEMDFEGALAFARFDEGATVPKFYFFRDGLGLFFPGQGGRVPARVAGEQGCIL